MNFATWFFSVDFVVVFSLEKVFEFRKIGTKMNKTKALESNARISIFPNKIIGARSRGSVSSESGRSDNKKGQQRRKKYPANTFVSGKTKLTNPAAERNSATCRYSRD